MPRTFVGWGLIPHLRLCPKNLVSPHKKEHGGVRERSTQMAQPEQQSLCHSPCWDRATSPEVWVWHPSQRVTITVQTDGGYCLGGMRHITGCREEPLGIARGGMVRGGTTGGEGRDPGGLGKNCLMGTVCPEFSLNSISKYLPGWGTPYSVCIGLHGCQSTSRMRPLLPFAPRHLLQPGRLPGLPHECRYGAGVCLRVCGGWKQNNSMKAFETGWPSQQTQVTNKLAKPLNLQISSQGN